MKSCLIYSLFPTRSISSLKNFAGAESPRALGAGVINLDSSIVGRSLADSFLHELHISFSGTAWGSNGPGVITRVLQRICQVKKVRDLKFGVNRTVNMTLRTHLFS